MAVDPDYPDRFADTTLKVELDPTECRYMSAFARACLGDDMYWDQVADTMAENGGNLTPQQAEAAVGVKLAYKLGQDAVAKVNEAVERSGQEMGVVIFLESKVFKLDEMPGRSD